MIFFLYSQHSFAASLKSPYEFVISRIIFHLTKRFLLTFENNLKKAD